MQWEAPSGGQALTGPFVPSATFTGAAQGYVFKMGAKGLGYYQDTAPGISRQIIDLWNFSSGHICEATC